MTDPKVKILLFRSSKKITTNTIPFVNNNTPSQKELSYQGHSKHHTNDGRSIKIMVATSMIELVGHLHILKTIK